MSAARYGNTRDVTGTQPARGPGMQIAILFLCGHHGSRPGAAFRGTLPMRCCRCEAAKKERLKT